MTGVQTCALPIFADSALCNRQFLAQGRFTVADIGVALAAVRWFSLAEKFADVFEVYPEMPSLSAWLARVTDRPAYCMVVTG